MKNKKKTVASVSFDHDLEDSISMVMPILTDCDPNEDFSEGIMSIDSTIPILALRNMVLLPGVAIPVVVGREKSMNLVRACADDHQLIGAFCQKDVAVEEPQQDDLFEIGTVAEIMRVLDMPDGTTTIILQGKKRIKLNEIVEESPYLRGKVTVLKDDKYSKDKEFNALISAIKDMMIKVLMTAVEPQKEVIFSLKNNRNAMYLVNFGCSNLVSGVDNRQELLEISNLKERAYKLMVHLNREFQLLELKASIQMKTQEDLDKQQKEYFLQQQIKTIQEELGGNANDREIQDLKDKAFIKKWPAAVAEAFEKEVRKLQRLHPQSPDYSVQMQYVQTIVNLPWETYSSDNFNLPHAKKILDRDHYGLEKVKERIIEHLAVLKLKKDMKSPIICLYGPPGVGKPLWVVQLPRLWAGNMSAFHWADCMTKRKSVVTGVLISERCVGGLSRICRKRAHPIRCLSWMR